MATRSRPLHQDDLYRAKYVVGGVLSPDGSTAVYVLSETLGSGDEERQSSSLWQVAVRGGRPRRLTGEAGDDSNPRFAADGRSVLLPVQPLRGPAAIPHPARRGRGPNP